MDHWCPPGRSRARLLALNLLDVDRLRSLVAFLLLIGHLGRLAQRLEAVARDAGVMHEQIAAAVVGRDEAIALFVVEPLDGPGCHFGLHPSSLVRSVSLRVRERGYIDDRSRSGRRGNATSRSGGPASGFRAFSAMKPSKAPATSSSASVPSRCPALGTIRKSARGIRRASSRPASTGTSRSSSPCTTSTGISSSPSRSRLSCRAIAAPWPSAVWAGDTSSARVRRE